MDAALGKLVVSLEANIAKFEQDLTRGENLAKAAMKSISDATDMASSAAKTLGLALAGIGAGVSASALVDKFDSITAGLANLQHMSEKTGSSVENLSALGPIAKATNTDMETLANGLVKLDKSLSGATDETKGAGHALDALGLSADRLRQMDPSDALKKIAGALSGYADDGSKAALMQDLLGKRGAEMLPLMKQLAESGDLVAKVTSEQTRTAEEYEKTITKLNTSKDALYKTIALAALPAAKRFAEVMFDGMNRTDGLRSSVKSLAEEGSIERWANNATRAAALFVDTIRGAIDGMMLIGKGLTAAAADVRSFSDFISGLGAEMMKEKSTEPIKRRWAKMLDEMKFHGLMFEAEMEKTLGKESLLDQVNRKISISEAVQKTAKLPTLGYKSANADTGRDLRPEDFSSIDARNQQMLNFEHEAINISERAKHAWAEQSMAAERALQIMPEAERKMLDAFDKADRQMADMKERLTTLHFEGKIDDDVYLSALNRITAAGEKYKQQIAASADEQARLNAQWQYGASKALQGYLDQIKNVAAASEQMMAKAFQGMEDALVKFVRTGKLDFKSLADSIISDLIRMQIRASITGRLAAAMQNSGGFAGMFAAIGSMFGGGRASGGPVAAGTTYLVGERGPELFTPNTSGAILNSAQSAGNVQINITNNAAGATATASERSNGSTRIIDVVIDQVRSALASDISRDSGPIPAAMSTTYGLNRVAGAF